MLTPIEIELHAVIAAVTEETPRVLTVSAEADAAAEALPSGPLDPAGDRTLELGVRRWVSDQTALRLGYVEQLYTFGDRDRETTPAGEGPRVLSVAYLALVREDEAVRGGDAHWRDLYDYLPWEDWRAGRPPSLERVEAALEGWVKEGSRVAGGQGGGKGASRESARKAVGSTKSGAAQPPADLEGRDARAGSPGSVAAGTSARRERADVCFGLGGARWDGERVLERYELLYEAGLVAEALRDAGGAAGKGRSTDAPATLGRPMALDHRRMLATALGRLRGKIKYRPVVFELVPSTFTLFQLQRVVEALAGVRLHKQNFRRLVDRGGLVEGTGKIEANTGGRPAELFRFRREVLRERRAPGVGLPAARLG